MPRDNPGSMHDIFDRDEVRDVLADRFFGEGRARTARAPRRPAKAKPDHYQVICISLYREDLERLDAKVAELKRSGHRKMSRSALIRYALDTADLSQLPRGY